MSFKEVILIANVNQFGYSAGHYYYCKYLKDIYDVIYVCRDLGLKKIEMDGVRVQYIISKPNKYLKLFEYVIFILKQCYEYKPKTALIVYFKACFIIPLLYGRRSCILDIRTGSLKHNGYLRKLSNIIILLQSLFYKKIIILSESLRKVLKINEKKSIILPLGSDIYFNGIHSYDKINLLYVGTLDGRRITDTIKGVSIFLDRNPDLINIMKYIIIGFGEKIEENKIIDAISNNKLNSVVSFIGRKTYEELPEYFANSNIGVCYVPIEEYYDVQPSTKIFEYSLSGMITIATNTYENKLLINEKNGVLCDDKAESFCDALVKVYFKMKEYNQEQIKDSLINFSWQNLVSTILVPVISKH